MRYTLGFIGCGNMGGALVTAASREVICTKIAICDYEESKTAALEREFGVTVTSAVNIAKHSRFVILGVKPQVMEDALSEIAEILCEREDLVVVSMAAGLSIKTIRSYIGEEVPMIRIMPNTPVAVGAGMILYVTDGVDKDTEAEFLSCFEKAGKFDKITEDKIDAASAISGCGPAFVYAFAEALADGAVECGLPRDKAALYAAQTLLGAAEMLLEKGHPADLKDAVCSPGGTTIAGMHALEKAAFRSAAMDAVTAEYNKTLELKK